MQNLSDIFTTLIPVSFSDTIARTIDGIMNINPRVKNCGRKMK